MRNAIPGVTLTFITMVRAGRPVDGDQRHVSWTLAMERLARFIQVPNVFLIIVMVATFIFKQHRGEELDSAILQPFPVMVLVYDVLLIRVRERPVLLIRTQLVNRIIVQAATRYGFGKEDKFTVEFLAVVITGEVQTEAVGRLIHHSKASSRSLEFVTLYV